MIRTSSAHHVYLASMQQLGQRRAQTVRRASTTMLVRAYSAKIVRLATFLKHSLRRVLSALLARTITIVTLEQRVQIVDRARTLTQAHMAQLGVYLVFRVSTTWTEMLQQPV